MKKRVNKIQILCYMVFRPYRVAGYQCKIIVSYKLHGKRKKKYFENSYPTI